MIRYLFYVFACCLILLVACSSFTSNGKEDVIAVLDGEDIKGKDILTQYQIEDSYIEVYLKEEIVIHEAKKIGIEVSDEEVEERRLALYPSLDMIENREFYELQAATLDVSAEEYFELWAKEYLMRNEYIQQYVSETFADPSDGDVGGVAWGQEINQHIHHLYLMYQEEEQLVIY